MKMMTKNISEDTSNQQNSVSQFQTLFKKMMLQSLNELRTAKQISQPQQQINQSQQQQITIP
jgi:hypothetical protein